MALKIDGYKPADPKIALEQGTTFDYNTPFGKVTIIARMAGKDNKPFVRAFRKMLQRHQADEARGYDNVDQQNRDYAECYFDHLVIRWSTTVKSEGKEIAPTRENFVELMTSEAISGVFLDFMKEVAKAPNFIDVEVGAAAEKN